MQRKRPMISMAGKLCIILDFASFAVRAWECRILFRFWERRARVWRSRSRQTAAQAARWDPWSELMLVRPRSSRTVRWESQHECEDQCPCCEPRALGAAGSGTTDTAAVASQSQHAKLRSRCCGPAGGQEWACRTWAPGPETECGPNRLSSEPERCIGRTGQTGKSERTDGKPTLNR
jgi:hypothetical protein